MKKIYLLLALVAVCTTNAQVPNNGFEETLEDGFTLKNWGAATVGENPDPNILFDNGFGFSMPVGDCLTGSWAIQISNAFDIQSNTAIPGKASLFDDAESDVATGSNIGIPLPQGSIVQFLGFDYKFFPMGNDVATAKLELFNAGGQSVGIAQIDMSQMVSDFQYVYVPIDFTSADTPTFMTIDFFMQKGDSEVNSWSTLVVDNVVVNTMMLGVDQPGNANFTLYPSVTDSIIHLTADELNGNIGVSIINQEGKIVQDHTLSSSGSTVSIDVSALASGVYFLRVDSGASKTVKRFVKK